MKKVETYKKFVIKKSIFGLYRASLRVFKNYTLKTCKMKGYRSLDEIKEQIDRHWERIYEEENGKNRN